MKRILFERPVSDYLPDEFKKGAKEASKRHLVIVGQEGNSPEAAGPELTVNGRK